MPRFSRQRIPGGTLGWVKELAAARDEVREPGIRARGAVIHDEAISRVAHSVKVSTKLDVATMSIRAAGQVS
jgi:hypothetical protein